MNVRNRLGRRAVVVATGALLAMVSVSAGAAMTASAQADPNNMPGQEYTDWDPGTPATSTAGNSGTPWVADQYSYVNSNLLGFDFYARNDGTSATPGDANAFQQNYGYSRCVVPYWTTQIMCND